MSHFERNYFEHRFIIWLTCIAVAKLAKTFHDNWFFFHQLLFSKPIFWFSEKLVELWWSLHVDITKQDGPQGSRNVWKSEGASSNVVKIICSLPSVEIGFADLPKFFFGGGIVPLAPRSLQSWNGENEHEKNISVHTLGSGPFCLCKWRQPIFF